MNLTGTHPDRWVEPSPPAVVRTRSALHARYIDHLASRRPTTWTQRPPWRAPSLTGALAVAVVVLMLLVRHRRPLDIERTGRDIAASLGVLVELLVVLALGVPAVAGADDAGLDALLIGSFILVPALVIAGAASFLLRFAARDLVRTWARAWGWEAVR